MLAALIVVFREVIEAGLIVGIVLAATESVLHRGWWISAGIAAGVAGACIVAVFAGAISKAFAGFGQELFNACILLAAVCMLTWHNVWMASHGREIAMEMKAAGESVVAGTSTLSALAIVVGVAVLREGFEVVLFLYGILASEGTTGADVFFGGLAGLVLGAGVSALTYLGLLRVPSRHLFAVTTVMITFLAAGLAAQAVSFLEQANVITWLGDTLWDSSALLSETSVFGKILHTLIGYTEQPTGIQLLAYVSVLAIMWILMKSVNRRMPMAKAARTAA